MTRQPRILAARRGEGGVTLDLEIPPDLVYLRGHFREQPIMPGVLQVDWAVRLAREHFPEVSLRGFRRLSGLKFTHLMTPGAPIQLQLSYDATRRELRFRYTGAARDYSSGRVAFA